jgi:hypothetical protein
MSCATVAEPNLRSVPEPPRGNEAWLGLPAGVVVVLIPVAIFFAGWGLLHGIGAAICSSYNFISNDLCDRWHFEPPPEDAVPLPRGWMVRGNDLDCGSGGCPTRVYVVEAPGKAKHAVRRYVDELRALGWAISESGMSKTPYFLGRKGNLHISIELARHAFFIPGRFKSPEYVRIGLSFVDRMSD